MSALRGAELSKEWTCFICSGDEQAYYDLYTHYYDYLTFIGLKKGADAAKVKNCINDVFLYLWEKRGVLGEVKNHHNYIVTAYLRKLLRKERNTEMYSIESVELPEYTAIPSVESLYILDSTRQGISRILMTYLEQLPEKQRKLIYQKFYLGLSYKEISAANGISVNTVYNTVYKAVDKLKLLISKEHSALLSLAVTALSVLFLFFLYKH